MGSKLIPYSSGFMNSSGTPVMFFPPQFTPKVSAQNVAFPTLSPITLHNGNNHQHLPPLSSIPGAGASIQTHANAISAVANTNLNNNSTGNVPGGLEPGIEKNPNFFTFYLNNGSLEQMENMASIWTPADDQKLLSACRAWQSIPQNQNKRFNFDEIQNSVPGKSSLECKVRWILIGDRKKPLWTAEQTSALERGIAIHGLGRWKKIALLVGKTPGQCASKWRNCPPATKSASLVRIEKIRKEMNPSQDQLPNTGSALDTLCHLDDLLNSSNNNSNNNNNNNNSSANAEQDDDQYIFDFEDMGDFAEL